MKRVWKPLDVGGLRLYEVLRVFSSSKIKRTDHYVVAATCPAHAAQLIEQVYKDTEYLPEFGQPFIAARRLACYIPESWWIDGVPCEHTQEGR